MPAMDTDDAMDVTLLRPYPYCAFRGDGQNACVRGPDNEVIVEVWQGGPEQQMNLATLISTLLNARVDTDLGSLFLRRKLHIGVRHA